ncbi:hypothetical protein ASPFODRAFT_37258 [Aspergillus luchuensis CBS 106.47]|uniref:Uncharacterized protein n=1 Tax=Aspergillus luchuensis (strain CBS 106.47) TaxID=1137211 RepID=A0A1M3T3W5_ASPLC|nr:hypothetical protein ASPFODRAFT_37258 [Aspergillus luchuensis CBS 106.47]
MTVEFRLIPSPDQVRAENGTGPMTIRAHGTRMEPDESQRDTTQGKGLTTFLVSLSACAFAQVLADFVQRFGHIYESSRQNPKPWVRYKKPGSLLSFIDVQVIGIFHSPAIDKRKSETMN